MSIREIVNHQQTTKCLKSQGCLKRNQGLFGNIPFK